MSCTKIGDFCKTAQEKILLRITLRGGAFVKLFTANEILEAGEFRRPKKENGFEYEASVRGQCSRAEPEWPETIGQTVRSGSITFTCREISNASLARLVTLVEWEGETLTISDQGVVSEGGEQEVFAYARGGTQGDTGIVTARISFSDSSIEDATLSYHVD